MSGFQCIPLNGGYFPTLSTAVPLYATYTCSYRFVFVHLCFSVCMPVHARFQMLSKMATQVADENFADIDGVKSQFETLCTQVTVLSIPYRGPQLIDAHAAWYAPQIILMFICTLHACFRGRCGRILNSYAAHK